MTWLKGSDKAATYPKVLNAPHFSGGQIGVNEMFGFIHRCAYESAAHRTDYVIEYGVALMMGGINHDLMIQTAEACGLLERLEVEGAPAWKIVEDPDFIHLITKAEQEWMNQQKRDSRDTKLTSSVRLRDGDACRYCLKIVYFGDRKSGRSGSYTRTGTYDHVNAGEQATYDTLVVACGECNSKKKDNDDVLQLQPPPVEKFYTPSTAAWLAKHGHHVQPSEKHPALKRKTTTADGEPSAPRPVEQPTAAPGRNTQATEATTGQGSSVDGSPGTRSVTMGNGSENPPDQADHLPDGSGFVGSGRDGSGRVWQGRAAPGASPPSPPVARTSQSSRRRRSRPRTRGNP